MLPGTHPILSCEAARALEAGLFAGEEPREWNAMVAAGRAVASAVQRDFNEIGGWPANGRMLVAAGKGHNGGDALIAAAAMLARFPAATADVVFVFGERKLRPLAARAWRELQQAARGRVHLRTELAPGIAYDLCLDGVFGFQFRPPAEPPVTAWLDALNAAPIRLRAAIDLPSAGRFRADFTYATGSVKSPVVGQVEAGRVRYLDLGFFRGDEPGNDRVLTRAVLAPRAALRLPYSDKRTHGHVFIVGGSRRFPGAVLMTVLAALRSGVGLVTAFIPESVAPAFAARAPEAMWVGWPETPEGGLALEGEILLRNQLDRATALIIGPGLGRESESLALVEDIVRSSSVPLVIDADALQPQIVRTGNATRIITPHAGEFTRVAGPADLRAFAAETHATVVLKGPVTRIAGRSGREYPISDDEAGAPPGGMPVYHSFFGGPVLARGGSGDILAGLIGGWLAQTPDDPLAAAAGGVVWHGVAADCLARAHGQVAVQTTQLLEFLEPALRDGLAAAASREPFRP